MNSFYSTLAAPEPDALHGIMAEYQADARANKMDLGVGVYRNSEGRSPVMKAIKLAEQKLISAEHSKSYLGLVGVEPFINSMRELLFEDSLFDRYAAIQCVGGSGGIRLAIELAALANPNITVHIGVPTWPNHHSICQALGVEIQTFQYFDKRTQSLCIDDIFSAVEQAQPGDIIILHGPCHNPTGADLASDQFLELVRIAEQRGVLPLIDAAYYGLGNEIKQDLQLMRSAIELCPQAFLAMSCSKAFSLYRERTGILFSATPNVSQRVIVQSTLEKLARSNYSMPPAHGANSVALVLEDSKLRELWLNELREMKHRIRGVRRQLSILGAGMQEFSSIERQKGIFSLLPIDKKVVVRLAREKAIFMPNSGRVNIAGIKVGDAERLVEAIKNAI